VLFQAPVAISPTEDQVITVYLDTGNIGDIKFKWRHYTAAEEYELWLAKDEAFNQIVLKQKIKPDNVLSPAWTLPETVSLEKGGHYFWEIRVVRAETGETGEGQWSKVMSFSMASPPPEEISGPQSTAASPPNSTPKAPESVPWIATMPPFVWIVVVLLLIIIPLGVFILSRTKR
jgi:hypothetical protein